MREQQRARADGDERPLPAGVLLLQLGKRRDQLQWFRLALEHPVRAATQDDEHVVVGQVLMRVLVRDLAGHGNALQGHDLGFVRRHRDLEGPRVWKRVTYKPSPC